MKMLNSVRRNAATNAMSKRSMFGLSRAAQLNPVARSVANDPFFEPFAAMERRMNNLFGDFGSVRPSLLSNSPVSSGGWTSLINTPRMDVKETDKAYIVSADLPGIQKEQVSVSVKDTVLTISGEYKTSSEEKNEVHHIIERASGSFSRSIALPSDASPDEIKASMVDGVLKLEISKKEVKPEEGIKKISIE
ncbi:HSP20-like chaperone [Obelidium mucronatum]|nr:HSP20-like chaperone [Obelidium mucronatum]